MVHDLWDPNRGWKWGLFSDLLPEEIITNIASIEVHPSEDLEDQLICDGSRTGDFTIKSALSMIKPPMDVQVNQVWSRIWKLQAPQRIKFFLWLVAHERLMTNAHRVQRGLGLDPSCRYHSYPSR